MSRRTKRLVKVRKKELPLGLQRRIASKSEGFRALTTVADKRLANQRKRGCNITTGITAFVNEDERTEVAQSHGRRVWQTSPVLVYANTSPTLQLTRALSPASLTHEATRPSNGFTAVPFVFLSSAYTSTTFLKRPNRCHRTRHARPDCIKDTCVGDMSRGTRNEFFRGYGVRGMRISLFGSRRKTSIRAVWYSTMMQLYAPFQALAFRLNSYCIDYFTSFLL